MKYYIIAGEASGDLHGANLIKELKKLDSQAEFRFWGGDLMRNAAGEQGYLVKHYKEIAIIGLLGVIKKLPQILANRKNCKKDISTWQPSVVILIDYPGFNLDIAEYAHKKGFKVHYYIAPKLWASREGRAKKMIKCIDKLYLILPFEKAYFAAKNLPCVYVGNPLLDAIRNTKFLTLDEIRSKYKIAENQKYICLMAGSRTGEIKSCMPILRDYMQKFLHDEQGYKFIIIGAPNRDRGDYEPYLQGIPRVSWEISHGDNYSLLKYAEMAIVNTGTATLETALIGCPQMSIYRMSNFNFALARVFVYLEYVTLPNIILNRPVIKEFLQEHSNAENLLNESKRLLYDREYRSNILQSYKELSTLLGEKTASYTTAKEIYQSINL